MFEKVDIYLETRLFAEYFVEAFLILITIQLVSDRINNGDIDVMKEARMGLLIATILYAAKCINPEISANVLQGLAYAISGVILAKYRV